MSVIGVDIDQVQHAIGLIRARLGELPSAQRVSQTAGPVTVDASVKFDRAVSHAATALEAQLISLSALIEEHADTLKAAAEAFVATDGEAGGTLSADAALLPADAVVTNGVESASAPTTAPAASTAAVGAKVGSTAAGAAAKAGSF
jgi:hypothetical protein